MTHNPFPELAKLEGFIVLAGAGKMGGAMLDGWMASGLDPKQVIVLEPSPSPDIKALATKGLQLNPAHAPEAPIAALIVAVKPQMFADAAATLKPYVTGNTLVLSIMAGQTRHAIARALGGAVVRTMPNTPAAIGRGITVAIATDSVTNRQRALTDQLLAATGALESGRSGPASNLWTSSANSWPKLSATSNFDPSTPPRGFESAPQPIEINAVQPGLRRWICSIA